MPTRKQYRIADFAQLCQLFIAGHGEFHFFNTKTNTQFNIKFVTGIENAGVVSRVYVCFTNIKQNNNLFYIHIGRYTYKTKLLELCTTPVVSERQLRMFLNTLDWVLNHINTGKLFDPAIECYYSGYCCRCGKSLNDAVSLARGLGEECAKKVGPNQPPVLFSKVSTGL